MKRKVTDADVADAIKAHPKYPDWLREAASKGGKESRRKLTKKEAKRMAAIRWGKPIVSGQ